MGRGLARRCICVEDAFLRARPRPLRFRTRGFHWYFGPSSPIGEASLPGPGIDDPEGFPASEPEFGGFHDEEADLQWEYYKAAFRTYQPRPATPAPSCGHGHLPAVAPIIAATAFKEDFPPCEPEFDGIHAEEAVVQRDFFNAALHTHLMRPAAPSPSGNHGPPPAVSPFLAATTFRGRMDGMVFTTGQHGTGYYADRPHVALLGGAGTVRKVVALELSSLIAVNAAITDASRRDHTTRARRRRPKHRRWCPEKATLFALSREAVAGDCSFREAGLWAFDSLNGNCSTTAATYLERTAADACMLQEMRVRTANCAQTERSAAHGGWALSVGPAFDTAAGSTSAGVAVAARSHFGLARSPGIPAIEVDRSRIIVRWLGTVCRGGIHLVSVYLYFGEGLSQRNIDLMQSIAGIVGELRGPWILAGDFNLTPEDVRGTGWLELLNGVLHAPSAPTCNGRVIDFFVTSASLASAVVAVSVVLDSGTSPHSAVRLLLRASPRSVTVNTLRKHLKFAAMLPAGCAPPAGDYSDVIALHGAVVATSDNLNHGYEAWISRVEDELADVCSLDTHQRRLASGRAQGPTFVLQPAMGQVGTDGTRVQPTTSAWQILSAWLGQVQQALCALRVLHSRTTPEPRTRCHPVCTVARVRARLVRHDWGHLGITVLVGSRASTTSCCMTSLTLSASGAPP